MNSLVTDPKSVKPYSFLRGDVELYKIVADEMENRSPDQALWMRAFELSGGKLKKQKEIYVRLRAKQLKKASKAGNIDIAEAAGKADVSRTTSPVTADSTGPGVRSNHKSGRFVTWLIIITLVVMLVTWWKVYLGWQANPRAISQTVGQQESLAIAESYPAVVQVLARDVILTMGESKQEPGGPAETNEVSFGSANVDADGTASPVIEPELMQPPVVAEISASTKPELMVMFSGECWVDIRDSKQQFKLYGTMNNGDVRKLGGEPPYQLLFGNHSVVELLVDGKPYDLSSHANGNAVKFIFDPATAVSPSRTTTLQASYVYEKIILASFLTQKDSDHALKKIEKQLYANKELVRLQKEYHFNVISRASGTHFIISAEPFQNKAVLAEVLTDVKKIYKDAFVNRLVSKIELLPPQLVSDVAADSQEVHVMEDKIDAEVSPNLLQ